MTIETSHDTDLPVVGLGYLLPMRETWGNPAYPAGCDPDGDPVRFLIDSPDSPAAIAVCGGVLAWHVTAEHIRSPYPGVWTAPAGVVAQRTGDQPGEWLVTGPGGQMLVRRTARRG